MCSDLYAASAAATSDFPETRAGSNSCRSLGGFVACLTQMLARALDRADDVSVCDAEVADVGNATNASRLVNEVRECFYEILLSEDFENHPYRRALSAEPWVES